MERISAACALEWSIELEKGLRSKKPGRPIEAILQIGPRLQSWSKELCTTMGVLNMFGLVPGEDRLFANTILLRLADAFRFGDRDIRLCVLKVFLLERKKRNSKCGRFTGMLANKSVPNYLELLKRVKIVFDTGDVEPRALALRLLGCWVDIAKDSADVRYMILSSLVSCHVMEVKASLFAAGCFSELSEDFASVLLEVLIKVVTSPKTSSTIKLACTRAFAKMGCSYMLASRAFKIGRKLVLESSEEEFIVEMLMSLSKLALKSLVLISLQVDLLLSFITNKSAFCIQSMALHCMHILLAGGVCRFPITSSSLTKLLHMLDNTNLPTVSECGVLRILLKVFRLTERNLADVEMAEFMKWVSIVESATQSPITSKRLLAFHVLVIMSCTQKRAMKMTSCGNYSNHVSSQVIVLILEQLECLVNPVVKPCETSTGATRECQSLLSLVLSLVQEYPTLGVLALTKIRSCMDSLLNVYKCGGEEHAEGSSVDEIVSSESEKHCPIASNFVLCIYRFVTSCMETLSDASAITDEVRFHVKLIVETMNKTRLYNTCTVNLLLLHSRVMWIGLGTHNKEIISTDTDSEISANDCWFEHEMYIVEFMKKMTGRDYWASYKAAKSAACQGSWFVAAYTFRQLKDRVQSDVFHRWLRSLAIFARAEASVLLLQFPKQGLSSANSALIGEVWLEPYCSSGEINSGVAFDDEWSASCKKFSEAYSDVCSAVEMLASGCRTDQNCIFQKWFLVLRSRSLEAVLDIFRLFDSAKIGKIKQDAPSLSCFLMQISFRLNGLAQEFDRLASSFLNMDAESYRSISRLALSCSLLAYCAGFSLYFPDFHTPENSRNWNPKKLNCSLSLLVEDLIERLWHVDNETSANLKRFVTTISDPNNCLKIPPRALVYKVGHREREILDVCNFALSGLLRQQKEAAGKGIQGESYRDSKIRLQFLLDIIKKWINISFQVPKFFFCMRPCIGAELYVSNADTCFSSELSVLPGFQLSLNLCLQLKRTPPVKITKLHCIIASKPSTRDSGLARESKGHTESGFQDWETDDTKDLNKKLWQHLLECSKETGKKHRRVCNVDGSVWSFATFEANERAQGFSTCVLDVSAFPVGSYRISWHSCCIDSKGAYWSLLNLNSCPVFSVKEAV